MSYPLCTPELRTAQPSDTQNVIREINLNNLQTFARTANGIVIGYDPETSHFATHSDEIPQLHGHVVDILSRKEIDVGHLAIGERIDIERKMKRVVGTTDRVPITKRSNIYYAKRPHRDAYTQFDEGAEPRDTKYVTLSLRRVPSLQYQWILWTAWTGRLAPSFPIPELAYAQPAVFQESVEFWSKWALSDISMKSVPETIRFDCPWAARALALYGSGEIDLGTRAWYHMRYARAPKPIEWLRMNTRSTLRSARLLARAASWCTPRQDELLTTR